MNWCLQNQCHSPYSHPWFLPLDTTVHTVFSLTKTPTVSQAAGPDRSPTERQRGVSSGPLHPLLQVFPLARALQPAGLLQAGRGGAASGWVHAGVRGERRRGRESSEHCLGRGRESRRFSWHLRQVRTLQKASLQSVLVVVVSRWRCGLKTRNKG